MEGTTSHTMKWLRFIFIPLLSFLIIAFAIGAHYYYLDHHHTAGARFGGKNHIDKPEIRRIKQRAISLGRFARQHNYNQKTLLLADMGLPSGKIRLFIYDTEKDTVVQSGLMAHGHANHGFSLNAVFSNRKGSSCTALGTYSIGKSYTGSFGLTYKLYGLDSSNSNAFARNIVLHGHACVPDQETYPYPICNSSGCAMVSQAFLIRIRPLLDSSTRPVLLWIFN